MKQSIYLVRHAQSSMVGKYCGWTDAPLSRTGHKQAKKLAKFFYGIPIQSCFVSDLKRVTQTVRYFSPKIHPIRCAELREINFGSWEKCSFEEVSARWPELSKCWMQSPFSVQIPGGEHFKSFFARINSFAKKIVNLHSGNVLIVAHGGVLAALSVIFLKRPLKEFWEWAPQNAAVTVLRRLTNGKIPKYRVAIRNETSHLNV